MGETLRGLIHRNQFDEARALLLRGCDQDGNVVDQSVALTAEEVNSRGVTGGTALHYACEHWAPCDLVTLLIKRGAGIDACDAHGNTPLLLAAWRAQSVMKALLEAGASTTYVRPASRAYGERSVLDVVLDKQNASALGLLLDYSPHIVAGTPKKGQRQISEILFIVTDKERIGLLVERGADINYICPETGDSLLHLAASEPDPAWMQILLDFGISPNLARRRNRDRKTPIALAKLACDRHPRLGAKVLKLLGQMP